YGENPHQSAKYVKTSDEQNTILNAKVLHGKELSYNNLRDADSAFQLAKKFDLPAAVAVKHMNSCGVGTGDTLEDAFQNAFDADNQSIVARIIALNITVYESASDKLIKVIVEVIIAPIFSEESLNIFTAKINIRLLQFEFIVAVEHYEFVSVSGGYLVQSRD